MPESTKRQESAGIPESEDDGEGEEEIAFFILYRRTLIDSEQNSIVLNLNPMINR